MTTDKEVRDRAQYVIAKMISGLLREFTEQGIGADQSFIAIALACESCVATLESVASFAAAERAAQKVLSGERLTYGVPGPEEEV